MYVEGLAHSKFSTDVSSFCDENISVYQGFFGLINNTAVSRPLYTWRIIFLLNDFLRLNS